MSLIDSNKLLSWIDDQARTDADEDRYKLIRAKIMDLMGSPQEQCLPSGELTEKDFENTLWIHFTEARTLPNAVKDCFSLHQSAVLQLRKQLKEQKQLWIEATSELYSIASARGVKKSAEEILDKHCKENDITFISAYWMSKGMTLPEGEDDVNRFKKAILSAMKEYLDSNRGCGYSRTDLERMYLIGLLNRENMDLDTLSKETGKAKEKIDLAIKFIDGIEDATDRPSGTHGIHLNIKKESWDDIRNEYGQAETTRPFERWLEQNYNVPTRR